MKKLLVIVGILCLCLLGVVKYCHYLNYHPIKIYHYFPNLTRKIPILKKIDNYFALTLGIDWYKVKHLKTGREYLMKVGISLKDGKEWVNRYWVVDNIKRDRWVEFSQEQFQRSFGNPTDGEALTQEIK